MAAMCNAQHPNVHSQARQLDQLKQALPTVADDNFLQF